MIDFLTVVFAGDIRLLRIQARSLALYANPHDVGTIVLAINDPDPVRCMAELAAVLPEYGGLMGRVVVLPGVAAGLDGWKRQQGLKFTALRSCRSEFAVILDAKNHLLRPCGAHDFLDGRRPRSHARTVLAETRRRWLKDSLTYFGVGSEIGRPMLPTTTPYCLDVACGLEMVRQIEDREGIDLMTFFEHKRDQATEFLLYYAFLLARGDIESRVSLTAPDTPCLFTNGPSTVSGLRRAFDAAEGGSIMFGVHRKRFAKLDAPFRRRLAALWTGAHLFESHTKAMLEIDSLAALTPGTTLNA